MMDLMGLVSWILLMNISLSRNSRVGAWFTSSGYTNQGPWNHGSPLEGGREGGEFASK